MRLAFLEEKLSRDYHEQRRETASQDHLIDHHRDLRSKEAANEKSAPRLFGC
jgi:hypothetical protein